MPKLDAPAGTPVIDPNLKYIYPDIYKYSVKDDTFRQISFDEASGLGLLENGSAPDGTVIVNENGYNGGVFTEIFGGGRSDYGLFLRNGSSVKKIIVQNTGNQNYYYNSNFRLLGWIK